MYVQVTISALNLQFQPNKLARSVEEAKLMAAEYTLTQIGVPVDGACVHGVCAHTVCVHIRCGRYNIIEL